MSAINRNKTFVELVAQRTPANARNDLDVYSKAETLAAIPPVDFAPVEADIAAISGDVYTLSGDVFNLLGDVATLQSDVVSISADLTTDIQNLDLSLTQKISEDCLTSDGISGSATTVTGHLKIYINGVEYKLGIVN